MPDLPLYVSTVTYHDTTITILTNPNECLVCHRSRAECDEYPWPNHAFIPANCDAALIPHRWRHLPRTEHPHTQPQQERLIQ